MGENTPGHLSFTLQGDNDRGDESACRRGHEEIAVSECRGEFCCGPGQIFLPLHQKWHDRQPGAVIQVMQGLGQVHHHLFILVNQLEFVFELLPLFHQSGGSLLKGRCPGQSLFRAALEGLHGGIDLQPHKTRGVVRRDGRLLPLPEPAFLIGGKAIGLKLVLGKRVNLHDPGLLQLE